MKKVSILRQLFNILPSVLPITDNGKFPPLNFLKPSYENMEEVK
jgi:hypothetical protein